jgi:hypothetical protein
MRCCLLSTPAHSSALSASATVEQAHSVLSAIRSQLGKQQPMRLS